MIAEFIPLIFMIFIALNFFRDLLNYACDRVVIEIGQPGKAFNQAAGAFCQPAGC